MPKRSTQSGVSMVEYGLILACIGCVCIVSLQNLGSQVNGNFGFVSKSITSVNGNLNSKKIGAMLPGKIPNLKDIKSGIDVNTYPAPTVGGTSQSAKPTGRGGGNNRSFIDANGKVHTYLSHDLSESVGDNTITITGASLDAINASGE